MEDCIFCRIVEGKTAAEVVYSDDTVVAFRDINPVAPVHVLVVPRRHIPSVMELTPEDAPMLAAVLAACKRVAEKEGLADRGMRILTNVGEEAGQIVMHLHFHLVGGREMGWPPG